MDISQIAKSTQEQAAAAWIDHLNQLRLDELVKKIFEQDVNLAGTLQQLNQLKNFVSDPEHILGSLKSKHGEIAEHVQVNIANARRIIEGLMPEYTFDGVARTAREDYLFNGNQVQSKYLHGLISTIANIDKGVLGHMIKYPDFVTDGGFYQIPSDQYELMQKLLCMSDDEVNKATNDVRRVIFKLREFQNQTGVDLKSETIRPAIAKYDEVQLGKIDNYIDNEETVIKNTNQKRRDDAYQASKPTLQEGAKATAGSAAVEGGMSFCLGVAKKLKSGKKLSEFTADDWKDVGIDTATGTGKGAIRGASVYGLTNFTATPAAVASALVTAAFGITAQATLLQQGKISSEDFIVNSEVVCLDVTVSAISSLMGQILIPVPVLGAIIGNTVGMFMYGIAKNNLSKQEQALMSNFNDSIQKLNEQLDANYLELLELLTQEFARFKSVLDLAFDLDVNVAFAGSIAMAQYVGCDEYKILWDKQSVDAYFIN